MPNLLADQADPRGNAPVFKMFSGALKAFEKPDGRKYLSCTASSNVEDLHGDTMTAACVMDMAPQAKRKSMTIFLNHSYDVPEDVFGTTVEASIVQRGSDSDGPLYDLDLEVVLNEANPRAIETYAAIKDQGVKLGVSIGAMIEDFEFKDKDAGWWGGLEIKEVNLLEASIVGIPANPRSWVQNAVRALKSWEESKPKMLEATATPVITPEAAKAADVQEAACPKCGDNMGPDHTCATETPEVTADATSPETTATADDASTEKTEEPTSTVDLEAALETAKATTPDSDTSSLTMLRDAFIAAMSQLEEVQQELVAEKAARASAEANFTEAANVIAMLSQLPLGRKAVAAPTISSFQTKYAGIYTPGILKLLDERNDSDS